MSDSKILNMYNKYIPQKGIVATNYDFFLKALAIAGKDKYFQTKEEFNVFKQKFLDYEANMIYLGDITVEFQFKWGDLAYHPIGFSMIDNNNISKSWKFGEVFDPYAVFPKKVLDNAFSDLSNISFIFDRKLENEWNKYRISVFVHGDTIPYCPPERIYDPQTQECVLKNSDRGLKLLNIAPLPLKRSCFNVGLPQMSATCWFNSIVNGLILPSATFEILYEKYEQLTEQEKSEMMTEYTPSASCPLHFKKLYFYKIFQQFVIGQHEKTLKSFDYPREMIDKLQIRSPQWYDERQHYHPTLALNRVIPILFDKSEYMIKEFDEFNELNPLSTTKIIYIKYKYFMQNFDTTPIPSGWTVASVCIVLQYKDDEEYRHAITGFVCNNKKYIYDSNQSKVKQVDFTDLKSMRRNIANLDFYYFTFVCLVRA